MNDNLLVVINALLDKGIPVILSKRDGIVYGEIEIGSKTGTGKLHWDEITSNVVLETRYGQISYIHLDNPIEDISYTAWSWYLDYRDRGYGPNETWLPIWIEQGLITKKKIETFEYVIN